MPPPYLPQTIRLIGAVLALAGRASAIWPVRVNKPLSHGIVERLLWDDPGVITIWATRILSIYWTAVWGWAALFGRWPPYFPI